VHAQAHDLVFPNGTGKPDGHFLKLKAIAKRVGVEVAELDRFRKTYADTLHEEGVSVNTIRIRLGHESLDVTLAYYVRKADMCTACPKLPVVNARAWLDSA
jgi:integrase